MRSSIRAVNSDFLAAFIRLSSKERFAKNLGQKIIQIKVNLGDYPYVVFCMTIDGYNCLES